MIANRVNSYIPHAVTSDAIQVALWKILVYALRPHC